MIEQDRPVETGVVNHDKLIFQVVGDLAPLGLKGLKLGSLFVADAVHCLRLF